MLHINYLQQLWQLCVCVDADQGQQNKNSSAMPKINIRGKKMHKCTKNFACKIPGCSLTGGDAFEVPLVCDAIWRCC